MGKGITIALCLIKLIVGITIATLCIWTGLKSYNITCDRKDGYLVKLPIFLIISGCICFGVMVTGCFFLIYMEVKNQLHSAFIFVNILDMMFLIGWTITGAIQLFKYSIDCKKEETFLWYVTLGILVFQWVSLLRIFTLKYWFN